MGYISIRRTRELKATDLRIELQKAANVLSALTDELPTMLERVKISQGKLPFSSLQTNTSIERITLDLQDVHRIQAATPEKLRDLESSSHAELENRIIAIHQMHLKAMAIKERGEASIQEAEKQAAEFYRDMNRILSR